MPLFSFKFDPGYCRETSKWGGKDKTADKADKAGEGGG